MKSKRLKAVKSRTESDKDTLSMSKNRFKGATIENCVRNSSRAKGTRDFTSKGDSKHSREAIFDQDDSPATTKKDPPRLNKKRCASVGMKESPSKRVKLESRNKEGNQKRNLRKNNTFNKDENEDKIVGNSSSKGHEAIKGKQATKRKSPVKSRIQAENRSSSRNKSKERKISSPPDGTPSPVKKVKTVGKKLEVNSLGDNTARNKLSSPEQVAMVVDKENSSDESSDSEGVAWEDVDEADVDHHIVGHSKEGQLASTSKDSKSPSKKNVEISIALPGARRKGWSQEDVIKCIKRAVNRYKKEVNTSIHKVHLLSLLGHGFFRNRVCNDPFLQAVVLSRVPSNFVKSNKRKWDVAELTMFLKWFQSEFPSKEGIKTGDLEATKQMTRVQNLSEIFVMVSRALGFSTRLVYSMQPISGKGNRHEQRRSSKATKKRSSSGADRNRAAVKNSAKLKGTTTPNEKTLNSKVYVKEENGESCGPQVKNKKKMLNRGKTKEEKSNGVNNKPKVRNLKRRPKRKQRKVNYSLSGSDDEGDSEEEWNQQSSDSEEDLERNDCSGSMKNSKTPLSRNKRASSSDDSSGELGNRSRNLSFVELVDSDSDFEASSKPVIKGKLLCGGSRGRKSVALLSDDSDESVKWQGTEVGKTDSFVWGADWWSEVYLPSDKKWICVHLESSSVNHPELCEEHATQPLVYLVSFDSKNAVKDVTNRYASSWMSKTRKLRLDPDWWEETLFPYRTKNKKMDQIEDSLLEGQMLDKPLPTTINEFKNHPLYVLKRHLLKFEGLYPETAAILGYCRSEAVYSRDCVHLLHTREKWLNEALVVKQGEKPYKVVKGRPKRNQPIHERDSVTIDLFGRWQTEDYRPPPAKNGKVPRNEYGNVELFKECMLPPGTKHIKISGIQRVAKKLGIDCAQAVVGFDFHCGFSHPVIDGVVVCEEFESVLLDAWREEEEEAERKRAEKQEKRVLGSWKLLTRSLLIRERLKKRYSTQETRMDQKITNEESTDAVASASVSWPLNMQEGRGSLASDGHCHVFLESDYKQDSVTGEWTKSCSCGLTLPFEKL